MRLAKRLVAFKPAPFSQSIDDAQCRFHALALCIVNDSRSIAASVHAGGNPTRSGTRKFRGFSEQIDECLLPTLRDREYVDLGNDRGLAIEGETELPERGGFGLRVFESFDRRNAHL
jgi:hypothetical protein